MRLFRDAPVPMTTEGVGETSSFADALYFFGVCMLGDCMSRATAAWLKTAIERRR